MVVQIPIRLIQVPAGQRILLHGVDWEKFEAVLEELGEQRSSRIAYDNGTLEIMAPLPIHEFNSDRTQQDNAGFSHLDQTRISKQSLKEHFSQ